MGYDRGDSFPFDFERNGNPFGSKLKGNLSPRSYPIQCEWKWKHSFFSVYWAETGTLDGRNLKRKNLLASYQTRSNIFRHSREIVTLLLCHFDSLKLQRLG